MSEKLCPECGVVFGKGISTCPNCGEKLEGVTYFNSKRIVYGGITLAIILLAGYFIFIGLKHYQAKKELDKFRACQTNCKVIAEALRMYASNHEGHYPDSLEKLVPNYLHRIPECPAAGKDTYSWSYKSHTAPTDTYSFYCGSENHPAIIMGDFPRYHSDTGLITGIDEEEQ